MTDQTWLDVGASLASSVGKWFVSQATAPACQRAFSVEQLDLLQEVIKASMLGMARVIADKFDENEKRLSQLEASLTDMIAAASVNVGATVATRKKARRKKRNLAKLGHKVNETGRVISLWDELFGGNASPGEHSCRDDVIEWDCSADDIS